MKILDGKFYANDHVTHDTRDTNIMLVLSKRTNSDIEVESNFYITETMSLKNGEIESIHQNDWLPEFFEREATNAEIEIFKRNRESYGELKHWAEHVTGFWVK